MRPSDPGGRRPGARRGASRADFGALPVPAGGRAGLDYDGARPVDHRLRCRRRRRRSLRVLGVRRRRRRHSRARPDSCRHGHSLDRIHRRHARRVARRWGTRRWRARGPTVGAKASPACATRTGGSSTWGSGVRPPSARGPPVGPRSVCCMDPAPTPRLRACIDRYVGYRMTGFPPGLHRGLPSRHMTFIAGIGPTIDVVSQTDPDQAPASYGCVLSGLQASSAVISHTGHQEGVAIELTPLGCRTLFGMPSRALWNTSVECADVAGAAGRACAGQGHRLEPPAPRPPLRRGVRPWAQAGCPRGALRAGPRDVAVDAVVRDPGPGRRSVRLLRPGPPRPGLRRAGRLRTHDVARRGASIFPRRSGGARVIVVA
jgi:hypothetical protein